MTFVFYASIILFMGFASDDIPSLSGIQANEQDSLTYLNQGNRLFGDNQKSSFIGNVITGFSNIPIWINTLIFAPLLTVLIYIVVTSFIPTLDGGS